MHRFVLVNPAVKDANGESQRHHFYVAVGTGIDGRSCPHCHQEVQGGFQLSEDGTLHDAEGNEVNPHDLARQHVERMNGHQARLQAYAQKHQVPVLKR